MASKKTNGGDDRPTAKTSTRTPRIERETRSGRPTAYAVMKEIWSTRGEVRSKGVKFFEDGPVVKAQAINVLKELDQTAAAPFMLQEAKGKLAPTLVPVQVTKRQSTKA